MTYDLSDHTALITGPAGNLGSAAVKKFSQAGAALILPDRKPGRLQSLYPDLAQSSRHQLLSGVDLLNFSDLQQAVGQSSKKHGAPDVLIHTVGGFTMGDQVYQTDPDTWNRMIDLNVQTLLNILRVVVPLMLDKGSGKIVTVGARPSFSGKAKMGAYGAAKASVLRLTESLAAEVKSRGINANCIIPGTIDTPENREAMPDADRSSWVSPDSLADVILFLSSPAARDIHGAAVPVYGA